MYFSKAILHFMHLFVGNETIGNAQQNRTGQVSHSVVVGTVNIADQGEGMGADIARVRFL